MKLNQLLIPVNNFDRSFTFYESLGLIPIVKSEIYARYLVPGNNATLSIQQREKVKTGDTEICFEVDNVDEKVNELKKKGIAFIIEPITQSWNWREAHLKDPDGNTIIIFHAGRHRTEPDNKII